MSGEDTSQLVFGVGGSLTGLIFFIGICLTMMRITHIKRLQEDSLKTLLEIRHGLVMITAILTRNDTTDPATPLKNETKDPESRPISKKPDDVGSKISFDEWAKQNPIDPKE